MALKALPKPAAVEVVTNGSVVTDKVGFGVAHGNDTASVDSQFQSLTAPVSPPIYRSRSVFSFAGRKDYDWLSAITKKTTHESSFDIRDRPSVCTYDAGGATIFRKGAGYH